MTVTDQERLTQIADVVIELRAIVPVIRDDLKDVAADLKKHLREGASLEADVRVLQAAHKSSRALLYPTFIAALGLVVKAAWGLLTGK